MRGGGGILCGGHDAIQPLTSYRRLLMVPLTYLVTQAVGHAGPPQQANSRCARRCRLTEQDALSIGGEIAVFEALKRKNELYSSHITNTLQFDVPNITGHHDELNFLCVVVQVEFGALCARDVCGLYKAIQL